MVSEHHICWGGGHSHPHHHELRVCGIFADYGADPVLEDISFSVPCGHTLALIGPNGAGKSTLLNVLAGLLKPRRGDILWSGAPLRRQKHEIAYLPQIREIDRRFPITVREVVAQGRYVHLGPWRSESSHDRDIIAKALETLGIIELEHRPIGALSGGQQQRVFIARALAQEAHILLLDEPFTGLDVPSARALSALLRELAAEGRLVIAGHHDLSSAASIFDDTLLLRRRALAFGPTQDVLTEENLKTAFSRP